MKKLKVLLMKKLLFFIIMIILSGCTTIHIDTPTRYHNTHWDYVDDLTYRLTVKDQSNIGSNFIFVNENESYKSDQTISEITRKNFNTILNGIGLIESNEPDIDIIVNVRNAYVKWPAGFNITIESQIRYDFSINDAYTGDELFDVKLEGSCISDEFSVFNISSNVGEEMFKCIAASLSALEYSLSFTEIEKEVSISREIYQKQLRDKAEAAKSENIVINRDDLPILTVFDFEYEGISENEANFLVDYLSGALFDTGYYRIIDRSQREATLSEIKYSMTGCTDVSCQLEMGKALSADYMVVGSLGNVGSRFVINAQLIDIESNETFLSARGIYLTVDSMLDGCSDLANELSIKDQY